MKRLSGSSNPTNLKEISKNKLALSVLESGGKKSFTLDKLDLNELNLPENAKVICTARSGKTSKRFEVGTVSSYSRKPYSLDGIDESSILKFRLFVREESSHQLLASAEGVRPVNIDDQFSESLIPMSGADLGQLVWKLELDPITGPTLIFNNKVFPNAAGTENFVPFTALVIPEVLRQVLKDISDQPADLNDDNSWRYGWGQWLDELAFPKPQGENAEENVQWLDETVALFCDHFSFSAHLSIDLHKGKL